MSAQQKEVCHFEDHMSSSATESTHGHSHGLGEHGHTHEQLDSPGRYAEREVPKYGSRNWKERAFTIGIGGYVKKEK
jgi:urease accessory protein